MNRILPQVSIHQDLHKWVESCDIDTPAIAMHLLENEVPAERVAALKIEIGRAAIKLGRSDMINYGKFSKKKQAVHIHHGFAIDESLGEEYDPEYQEDLMNTTLIHELQHVINNNDKQMKRQMSGYRRKSEFGAAVGELLPVAGVASLGMGAMPFILPNGTDTIDGAMNFDTGSMVEIASHGGVILAAAGVTMYALNNLPAIKQRQHQRYLDDPDEVSARAAEERVDSSFIRLSAKSFDSPSA